MVGIGLPEREEQSPITIRLADRIRTSFVCRYSVLSAKIVEILPYDEAQAAGNDTGDGKTRWDAAERRQASDNPDQVKAALQKAGTGMKNRQVNSSGRIWNKAHRQEKRPIVHAYGVPDSSLLIMRRKSVICSRLRILARIFPFS